ncbi:hypothetical protein HMPREF9318_00862 [Streptococcus urinalis FB127-CNA-2]|nr:hypothetical protein HMPREF9318_00862 [Streptococcus urinalis FB127-CNA-2]VEF33120.1 DNA-binding protein [Streptococcus urinalis]
MMTIFSNQLKQLRIQKDLSQEALAQKLYISRQAISKWENGDATLDLDNLIKLAEILEVSLDELVLKKSIKIKYQEDEDNLHLLKSREYVINPETGHYEKRDGMAIFIDLISEYWWVLIPIIWALWLFFK